LGPNRRRVRELSLASLSPWFMYSLLAVVAAQFVAHSRQFPGNMTMRRALGRSQG
jgi:hypothetical protein